MSGHFRQGDGDWVCADASCGNVNFSRRTQCNKCGKDKNEGKVTKKGGAEIGKHMAEKSKGLFSADDWQCKTCGNVNWARRNTCNVCNGPKMGKIESRTGYGGGFMEREEIVEYKNKTVDDSEYDEFGRKKKQYRGKLPVVPSIIPVEEEEEEEEDDDDEDISKYKLESDDDDDEDADLSKYALSDSDDDSNNKKKKSSSRSSSSSSSSSSRSSRSSRSSSRSRSRSKKSRSRSRSPRSRHGSDRRSRSRSPTRSRSRSDSGRQEKRSRHRSTSRDRDRRY